MTKRTKTGRLRPRRALVAMMSRLRELGFEPRECQGRIQVLSAVSPHSGYGLNRKQMERIYDVADRYGARVYVGKVTITKPRYRGRE